MSSQYLAYLLHLNSDLFLHLHIIIGMSWADSYPWTQEIVT